MENLSTLIWTTWAANPGTSSDGKVAAVARGTTSSSGMTRVKFVMRMMTTDDFCLYRVWKAYKEFLSDVPTKPLRGPPKWDTNGLQPKEVNLKSRNCILSATL